MVALVVQLRRRAGLRAGLPRRSVAGWLLTGLHGRRREHAAVQIIWYFAKAGAFVFGSGLAIVPFLYGGVVKEFGWLTERQFLDAVAVAMITPGPVVITVAFIGYLVAGPVGALLAALGVFLPCYLFVVVPVAASTGSAKPAGEGVRRGRDRGGGGRDRRGLRGPGPPRDRGRPDRAARPRRPGAARSRSHPGAPRDRRRRGDRTPDHGRRAVTMSSPRTLLAAMAADARA